MGDKATLEMLQALAAKADNLRAEVEGLEVPPDAEGDKDEAVDHLNEAKRSLDGVIEEVEAEGEGEGEAEAAS